MTETNGAHVEVTVRMGDPLTVTNEEPEHVTVGEFWFGIAALVGLIVVVAWIVIRAA